MVSQYKVNRPHFKNGNPYCSHFPNKVPDQKLLLSILLTDGFLKPFIVLPGGKLRTTTTITEKILIFLGYPVFVLQIVNESLCHGEKKML